MDASPPPRRYELLSTEVVQDGRVQFSRPVVGMEAFARGELIAIDGDRGIRFALPRLHDLHADTQGRRRARARLPHASASLGRTRLRRAKRHIGHARTNPRALMQLQISQEEVAIPLISSSLYLNGFMFVLHMPNTF
jgi:hypothetical protein